MRPIRSLAVLIIALSCACSSASPQAGLTEGLGKECKSPADCEAGQTCHTYSHPECPGAQCQDCQIRCSTAADCPAGYTCNLPPLLPDTVPNICAKM